jgi:hypothetical protein
MHSDHIYRMAIQWPYCIIYTANKHSTPAYVAPLCSCGVVYKLGHGDCRGIVDGGEVEPLAAVVVPGELPPVEGGGAVLQDGEWALGQGATPDGEGWLSEIEHELRPELGPSLKCSAGRLAVKQGPCSSRSATHLCMKGWVPLATAAYAKECA